MARRRTPFPVRTISVREQMAQVRLCWPHLTCQIRNGTLVCGGPVQPTAASRTYTIRLEYRVGRQPRTWVTSPRLERRGSAPDQPIPHTYNSKRQGRERPCLFFPRSGDWRSDKSLAATVIPWVYEWLVFYELWHITGEWLGGGIEHDQGSDK